MIVAAGGRVVILDRDEAKGAALARELADASRFACADVSDPELVQAAVETAVRSFGSLHIVVNCAGIGTPEKVIGKEGPASLDLFSEVVRINLIGTFNVIRLGAWAISSNEPDTNGERGVIVNTASIAAFEGQIGQAAYSASKAGIVGMTLPVARDLARHGIRVMTIAPGIFETPILGALPDERKAALAALVPCPPRLGQPAEFAALARHIIENPMLNGEVIRLDGAIRLEPRWVK